jgi:hypothetical protein
MFERCNRLAAPHPTRGTPVTLEEMDDAIAGAIVESTAGVTLDERASRINGMKLVP